MPPEHAEETAKILLEVLGYHVRGPDVVEVTSSWQIRSDYQLRVVLRSDPTVLAASEIFAVTSSAGCSPPGSTCDDGNLCTAGDTCSALAVCTSGVPVVCSDAEACTDDSCNPTSGCVFTNNAGACDDGTFCNGTDSCSGGSCSVHTGDPCPGPDDDIDCSEVCTDALLCGEPSRS